jgi:hypothetical protein
VRISNRSTASREISFDPWHEWVRLEPGEDLTVVIEAPDEDAWVDVALTDRGVVVNAWPSARLDYQVTDPDGALRATLRVPAPDATARARLPAPPETSAWSASLPRGAWRAVLGSMTPVVVVDHERRTHDSLEWTMVDIDGPLGADEPVLILLDTSVELHSPSPVRVRRPD